MISHINRCTLQSPGLFVLALFFAAVTSISADESHQGTIARRLLLDTSAPDAVQMTLENENDGFEEHITGHSRHLLASNIVFGPDKFGGGNDCSAYQPVKMEWMQVNYGLPTTWKLGMKFKSGVPTNVFVDFVGDDHVELIKVNKMWETRWWIASEYLQGTKYDGDSTGHFEPNTSQKFAIWIRGGTSSPLTDTSAINVSCDIIKETTDTCPTP